MSGTAWWEEDAHMEELLELVDGLGDRAEEAAERIGWTGGGDE